MEIKLKGVTKKYGDCVVFSQFEQVIKKEKTTCIMGMSGSGKTTLLRIMLGLESVDEGEIEGLEGLKKGVIFQENRLCENLTVAANVKMSSPHPIKENQILEEMQKVGLASDSLRQPVRELSGGQKRRVAILRALFSNYDILFMDEPFKGLDTKTKKQVMVYVKKKTQGKTVILVTHDEKECRTMGDEIVVLKSLRK